MSTLKESHKSIYTKQFFEKVAPIKLTEAKSLRLQETSWSILTDYYLESVKIDCQDSGERISQATIRVGDYSGQVICHIKGPSVGMLFGLSRQKWRDIECLARPGKQLFYRYFKDGLSNNFGLKQQLFYWTCSSRPPPEPLRAVVQRCANMRRRDRDDPFLQVVELVSLDPVILNIYLKHLQSHQEKS